MMDVVQRIEGLQTVATVQEALELKRQSAINLLSRLRKEGYVTSNGGGKQPRLYKVTRYRQLPRHKGMFDLLNKHNPRFKLAAWYDHQVHGRYTEEDAILDAIDTESIRALLATLRLFNHVTDWPRLDWEAKRRGTWNRVGALYDVARLFFRVRRMPRRYIPKEREQQALNAHINRKNFPVIGQKWNVDIPFNEKDVASI